MIGDLPWLWKVSRDICDIKSLRTNWYVKVYNHIRIFKNRLMFITKAIYFGNSLRPFLHSLENSPINKLIAQRPETVGAIVWPYQSKSWNVITRFKQIEAHYSVIQEFFPALDFHVNEVLDIANLGDMYENLHVVIDRPKWFIREGQLVINLFLADVRIYSLAFSFSREAGRTVAYVGALQGRNIDGVLDVYKNITKALYGSRPQDFLFEIFRIFCRTIGVFKILAVADSSRHHKSDYFTKAESSAIYASSYDRVWFERGGTLDLPDFFTLSVNPHLKNIEEIPSNKRSMYNKRYRLLEAIEVRIRSSYAQLEEIRGEITSCKSEV